MSIPGAEDTDLPFFAAAYGTAYELLSSRRKRGLDQKIRNRVGPTYGTFEYSVFSGVGQGDSNFRVLGST